MKTLLSIFTTALLLCGQTLWAQKQQQPDMFADSFFAPELLLQQAEAIGLTDDQLTSIQSALEKAQPRFQDLNLRLEKEKDALVALTRKDQVKEKAAIDQLDKMLDIERELRRTHVALMITLKNKLTAEQLAKLKEIRLKPGAVVTSAGPPAGLNAKLEKVKAGVDKWIEDGRNPSAIAELMQEFDPLMKKWKFKEAEGVLDQALKLLEK